MPGQRKDVFSKLRSIARGPKSSEECEFCSVDLAPTHRHLLELATRNIICACDPCALRFENVVGRWKLIPRDVTTLREFQMNDADWEAFSLPINLAFISKSSLAGKMVAMYPSPAGATESLVPLERWETLAAANPCLVEMQPDVQALLVNRLGAAGEYYLAPMDICYELVGLIRVNWRGLSGGDLVWREVEAFFERLRVGGRVPEPAHQEAHACVTKGEGSGGTPSGPATTAASRTACCRRGSTRGCLRETRSVPPRRGRMRSP